MEKGVTMISVSDAQALIEQHTVSLPAESLPLGYAHNYILREPITAQDDLPSFDRSAMDGYAIRADDKAKEFEVIGEIRAGHAINLEIKQGQAVRIFTGARMPSAGLRVVLQEHTEVNNGVVRLTKDAPGSNVRLRGEDARAGEVLLETGAVIDATAAAVLASVGKATVQVSRPLRIFHLTTGDEIVPPEHAPAEGQIRNSNASLIAALCYERGVGTVLHRHAPDDLAAMLKIVDESKVDFYDVMLISGGSGPGNYDFSAELFRRFDVAIHFRSVNVRPGKPLIFGTTDSQTIFGLPGNALSHFVCFHLFVRRAIERLMARPVSSTVQGVLAGTMSDTQNGRETWWPARTEIREGRLECRPVAWRSSGDITRLPSANALVKVPASTSQLTAGSMVELLFTRNPAN